MKRTIGSILVVFLAGFTFLTGSCTEGFNVVPPGDLVKQERAVAHFNAVEVGGAFEVFLTQGTTESLVVEAGENIIDKIITEVQGNTLKIKTEKGCCNNAGKMAIYLTFKDLEFMEISGACELKNEGKLNLDKLGMEVSGASEITLTMDLDKLDLNLSGASEFELYGSCEQVYVETSGASEINSKEFKVGRMTIDASGASDCVVNVTNELEVEASGATKVRYVGDPKVSVSKSGASSVKPY